MDFKLLFIVALCVIVSSVESQKSDDQIPPDTSAILPTNNTSDDKGDSNYTQIVGDTSDSNLLTTPLNTTDSSMNSSDSGQSTVTPSTSDDLSTQVVDSGQLSTVGPDSLSTSTPNSTDSTASISNATDVDASTISLPNIVGNNVTKTDEVMVHECKQVGRFAHPSSCTKYFYCWDNGHTNASVFTCPEHKAFDPVTQLCVQNYGVCALSPKCTNDKQVIPNPDDKWTFLQCKLSRNESNEFELHCKACADDREYDDKLGYCKLTSVNGEMVLDSDELTDEVACSEAGLFIDYEDDTKYYKCVVQSVAKGILKPVHLRCSIYHVFSMQETRCVPLSMLAKLNELHKTNETNNN